MQRVPVEAPEGRPVVEPVAEPAGSPVRAPGPGGVPVPVPGEDDSPGPAVPVVGLVPAVTPEEIAGTRAANRRLLLEQGPGAVVPAAGRLIGAGVRAARPVIGRGAAAAGRVADEIAVRFPFPTF